MFTPYFKYCVFCYSYDNVYKLDNFLLHALICWRKILHTREYITSRRFSSSNIWFKIIDINQNNKLFLASNIFNRIKTMDYGLGFRLHISSGGHVTLSVCCFVLGFSKIMILHKHYGPCLTNRQVHVQLAIDHWTE